MKSLSSKVSVPLAALAAVLLVTIVAAASVSGGETSSSAKPGAEPAQFKGEYNWTGQRETGRLDIYFVETGSGQYDVDFKFRFNGTPHTYSGTAQGSLTEGRLAGKVFNESERRSWVFEGEVENGEFSGEHREIKRFGERRTGTLSFKR